MIKAVKFSFNKTSEAKDFVKEAQQILAKKKYVHAYDDYIQQPRQREFREVFNVLFAVFLFAVFVML